MAGFDPLPGLRAAQGSTSVLALAAVVLTMMEGLEVPVLYLTGEELEAALGVGSSRTRQEYCKAAEAAGIVVFKSAGPRGIKFMPGWRALESRAESARDHRPRSRAESARVHMESRAESARDNGARVVVDVVEEPPYSPPVETEAEFCLLDPKAERAIADGGFEGFRSAMKDYLANRVPTGSQWGYIMTIRTWLDGGAGSPRGLHKLDEDNRSLAFASAFNELLQITPEEEAKLFRSARGRHGTTAVLRAKMEYLLSRGQSDGKAARLTAGPAESSIGSNFTGFPEDRR